jgi:hypothetical protein
MNPVIDEFDNKKWFNDKGQLHREDGPAEIRDGTKAWYINGKLHRIGGPAIICTDGTKCWYVNDKLHRLNGPAIEWANGDKEWWIDGKAINCKTKKEFLRIVKLKALL